MKKALKRIFSIFLAITIIFSSAVVGLNEVDFGEIDFKNPFAVKTKAANSGNCGANLIWSLDDAGTLTISGTGDMYDYDTYYDEYDYDYTDTPWCNVLKSINSIVINNGVTSIGNCAFYDCTKLISVVIPDSVTTIGESAFSNCRSLKSVAIPDSVTSMGGGAFYNCENLKSVFIEDLVAWCGIDFETCFSNPLYDAKNLYINGELAKDIVIPDSVTSIGNCAFINCTSLISITIPGSVTNIGEEAFYKCTSLTAITIPDSVTSIGEDAFYKCTSLADVIIGNAVKKIGADAFYGCSNLKSITIPDSVTSIGKYAFYNCENLTSVKNGQGVTKIGAYAFSYCTRLKVAPIGTSVKSIGKGAFDNCKKLTSITIPDSVTSIGSYAFRNCISLSSITIPDGVTNIDSYVFASCKSLAAVTIPDTVTNIGDGAFSDCTSLTSITIPDGVTSIGYDAFSRCTSLISITIPDSVSCISGDAFFETGYYNNANNWVDGVLYINNHLIAADKYDVTDNYSIKEGTRTIADEAFENCKSLISITIPDSVTRIGSYAFSNCTYIESITIPDSVTSIDDYAFEKCKSLTSITIPDSVTSIGWSAFYKTGFYNDSSNWNKRVLYIDNHLIRARTALSGKYVINDGIRTIATGAFEDCENLELIIIPESVTSVGPCAFLNCKSLKSITIPDSVTSIGSSAFRKCSGFTIYGSNNSCAQKYAKENNLKFVNHTVHIKSSWITDIAPTVYKAGEKHKECTECGKVVETAEISQLKCAKPVLKKVINENSYVKVTWGAVKGADLYRIYRMVSGGEYEYIGSTKNKYFNDKNAPAGKTCRYRIRAKNEVGYSVYSDSIAIKHIDEPKLKSIGNSEYGVLIKWGKVTGAEKYSVYRKVSGGEYKYIGATTKTYYTDKTAKSGAKYYYAIRAKRDDSISSQSASLSKLYLDNPTLNTPSSTSKGIGLKWSKVTGAEGYMVYRRTTNGSYKLLTTEKGVSNVTFRDTTAKKGTKYYYKVKAYKSKNYSAYSNTKSVTAKY